MTCKHCGRDRVEVMVALTEARDNHNPVFEQHLLRACIPCRIFFKGKQEVKSG